MGKANLSCWIKWIVNAISIYAVLNAKEINILYSYFNLVNEIKKYMTNSFVYKDNLAVLGILIDFREIAFKIFFIIG